MDEITPNNRSNYPTEQKAMTDVHGIKVTGGSFPAEIWAAYMKEAVKNIPSPIFLESPLTNG